MQPQSILSQGRIFRRRRNRAPTAAAASAESPADTQLEVNSGPGAYHVSGGRNVYRVTIPGNINPGDTFHVCADHQVVRVQCPHGSRPGESLQITLPAVSSSPHPGPTPYANNDTRQTEDPNTGQTVHLVHVPQGVIGGQQFPVLIQGRTLMVTCPPHAYPGMRVSIVAGTNIDFPPSQHRTRLPPTHSETQMFEVIVPDNVAPGQRFALLAHGLRFLVTCPPNARPGQKIRFRVPNSTFDKDKSSSIHNLRLAYNKHGWTRTTRASDMMFQWVRVDDNGEVEPQSDRFDHKKSAYVLVFDEGKNKPTSRINERGSLRLVPAYEAVIRSEVKSPDGSILVDSAAIASIQSKDFEARVAWFHSTCNKLRLQWDKGHIDVNIRRSHLLGDSISAVMSLSRNDLRKDWIFKFIGEPGLDAGGLAKDWFENITKLDSNHGMWQSSGSNQMCMQINPNSEMCDEDHLLYFRFMGRVLGKALLDRQLCKGHMAQYLYKHILGWPVSFSDLYHIDAEIYNNLKCLVEMSNRGEDLGLVCQNFTVTHERMGIKEELELMEGGSNIDLTNENLHLYLESCLRHRLMGSIEPQLNELLRGFQDVIPQALLTIFDFQELELIMNGMPKIDNLDWKQNTLYAGEYEARGEDHPVCRWFWEIVSDYDQEMKARLLQFATGTSGVPSGGFAALQDRFGNVQKFTINGAFQGGYPVAHTCFNRLDLPVYNSSQELEEKLKEAIAHSALDFQME